MNPGAKSKAPAADRAAKRARPVVYSMRALGRAELPATLSVRDQPYRLVQTVKHDFWAATGFYEDGAGRRVVLKMSRSTDFAGYPVTIIGRFLCRREKRFYNALADVANVPAFLGEVGEFGFIHDFVSGTPLRAGIPVPDGFFAELQALLEEIHRRQIAYVDTNKLSNILLGDDGKPHLIDFQISFDLTGFGNNVLSRWLLRRFQTADRYHVLKHKVRLRPDEATEEEALAVQRRHWLIRLHRLIADPYKKFRRRTFKRLRESGRLLPTGSE